MARVGEVTVFFGGNARQLNATIQSIGTRMTALGKKATALGGSLTTKLTLPLALIGGVAIKSFADFDFQMRRVAAVSSATGKQFKDLTDLARKMGRTTQFTAKQSAEAMTFLSVAGFKVTETMGALPGVLQLAAAGAVELGTAADIAAKILKGYNFDVKELGRVNDVLTKTFISSNTMLGELGEGFKVLAPIARTAGLQFEEMSAALGLLADNAFQGGTAGTGLRRVISGLLKPSKEGEKVFKAMGLQVIGADGKMRKLSGILRDLKVGLNNMGGQAEQAGLLMELFGLRGGPIMAALLKEGGDRLDEFTKKLEESGGVAERVAKEQMAGLKGALLELTSAIQDAGLALGKTLEPVVRSVGGGIKNLAIAFSESSAAFKGLAVGAGVFATAAGPVLLAFGALAASGRVLIGVLTGLAPWLKIGGLLVVGTLAWGSAINSLAKDFDTVFDGLPKMFDIPKRLLKTLVTETNEARKGILELLGGGGQRADQAEQEKLFAKQQQLVLGFAKTFGAKKQSFLFSTKRDLLTLVKDLPKLRQQMFELVTINDQLGTSSSEAAVQFRKQNAATKEVLAEGFAELERTTNKSGELVRSFTNAKTAASGIAENMRAVSVEEDTLFAFTNTIGEGFQTIRTDSSALLTNIKESADAFSGVTEATGEVVNKLSSMQDLLKLQKEGALEVKTEFIDTNKIMQTIIGSGRAMGGIFDTAARSAAGITAQLRAAEQIIDRINQKGGAKFTGGVRG